MGSQRDNKKRCSGGWPRHSAAQEDETDWPDGELVHEIKISDLGKVETIPKIENCEYLASYNWINDPNYPVILVPGSPPFWSPSEGKCQLEADTANYYQDQNAVRYDRYSAEPMLRALLAMEPDFDLSLFDVVGCGSSLGCLLRFCDDIKEDFRLNIDRVGNTIFFIYKESLPTSRNPNGYSHTFHEAHTAWDLEVKYSANHQRVIGYEFGGLKLLVLSQSDGYLEQEADLGTQSSGVQVQEPKLKRNRRIAPSTLWVDGFPTLAKAPNVSSDLPSKDRSLRVEMRGLRIPQKAIFHLKTRSEESCPPLDPHDIHRRVWVNQTPYIMYAQHIRGFFRPFEIRPTRTAEGIAAWEGGNPELLKRYQALLQ